MPELTTVDVENYTDGRLEASEPDTLRQLDAAYTAIRRFCGWHVTPVIEDHELILDGPGGDLLILPTLRLVDLTSITEDGVALDVSQLQASARGLVRKGDGYYGSSYSAYGPWWSTRFGGIEVTMTHGFEDADDFNSAVLSYLDRTSMSVTSGGQREVVGPFTFGATALEECSTFTDAEQAILNLYRLEPSP